MSFKRQGDTVEVGFGDEGQKPTEWARFAGRKFPTLDKVWLRLFATGNLDKPFSVEFDQFSVTPLPVADNK